MKRAVLLIFFIKILLCAYSYNEFLIKTQISIIPKLLLLDKKLGIKTYNGTIKIAILFEKEDYITAFYIKNLIKEKFDSKLGRFKLEIIPVKIEDFLNQEKINYTSIYILKSSSEKILKISEKIAGLGIESFTYDKNDLKYGFLFSIDLEKVPIIYMNKEAINKNFDFIPYLYQLVRLVGNV